MATAFRATVMLVVLVGLPAAWVYYGPLPPEAMGVIQRTIASAKHAIGWDEQFQSSNWADEAQKTAPRFDASLAAASQTLQQQEIPFDVQPKTPAVADSRFTLASATVPTPRAEPIATNTANVGVSLAKELEPHLSLLRAMNAADYTLENWGGEGRLYRFRCSISLGNSDDHTRQFEAIDEDPLTAVRQVVGEVTAWQNARHVGTTTRLR